ncbi:MAG: ATP-binding protein, partial [bacterium]|nr:ATP-binding protein [bacterium]
YGLELPASALSDGTMRFIALTVLQQDPLETGLICLEEPENGIHPERIGAMLRLLNDIVVETETVVDGDNPLRQIIINTHSPVVARLVGEGDLLFASLRARRAKQGRIRELRLACLDSTWRSDKGADTIAKGRILSYLRGASDVDQGQSKTRTRRVVDRFHPGQLDLSSVA